MYDIKFDTIDRNDWIEKVAKVQSVFATESVVDNQVEIYIDSNIAPRQLHPVHLVLLACLIRLLKNKGCEVQLTASQLMIEYLRDDLHIDVYFATGILHVNAESRSDLNLWQVVPEQSLIYSNHVADYLKRNYFCHKDLSMLKVVLDELYANISDHSHAGDIAYSYIHYDEVTETIKIAFCDFGIGIPESLRRANITVDKGYIRTATGKGVSSRSNAHNKGFGLDTVVSSIEGTRNTISIVSGNELFISFGIGDHERTWPRAYDFRGTLVFFDLPIDAFEEADYIAEFEL